MKNTVGCIHPFLQIILASAAMNLNNCPPNSSEDLCLLFCLYPSSMAFRSWDVRIRFLDPTIDRWSSISTSSSQNLESFLFVTPLFLSWVFLLFLFFFCCVFSVFNLLNFFLFFFYLFPYLVFFLLFFFLKKCFITYFITL